MTSKLRSITCIAPGQYSVQVDVAGIDQRLTFKFDVDDTQLGIQVVQRSDEFLKYVAQTSGPDYSLLMEAILRFHRAQQLDYP
jgi:hypothetical protein